MLVERSLSEFDEQLRWLQAQVLNGSKMNSTPQGMMRLTRRIAEIREEYMSLRMMIKALIDENVRLSDKIKPKVEKPVVLRGAS
jgi:predicted transcriptional regulator